jgi:hypothetical protein
MSTLTATDQVRTRTPLRRKPAPYKVEMPTLKKGEYAVALVRGQRYHLCSPDQFFERGQVKKVSEETYNWLAEHAVDTLTIHDGEMGRLRKVVRKFQFAPELDEVVEQVYVDLAE